MASGMKRDRDGNARPRPVANAPRGRFHDMFEEFRNDLDQHHDRRERIIKASRDVTAQSKKMVKRLNEDLPRDIEQDTSSRLAEIDKLLAPIVADMQSLNRHRYAYQCKGLEEFVEAVSFRHYLRHQTIITPAETQALLPAGLELTAADYLYGIFDLFGEMMRFATVTTAQTGELPGNQEGRNLLGDMQNLGCSFEMLREIPTKDFRGKMEVMRQSVKKVEKLGYGLVVRGSERPKGWVPDLKDDEAPRAVSPV
ncbi:Translin-associated protein X [Escovopsis weberi]|uniref:Translin-associated protein X n=1 Tax=Escovopsis weberi TaxID=150374 RepID=A0A0M9VVZ1_ESCWE|nr:Translin-associated protein X [Escovopsis weberi]